MGNTFLTPTIIANEALMVLENSLVMAGLVHRDYSKEFVKVGDTITIRKPAKFIAKNFTGTISKQDATEGSVQVKLDRFRDVSVPITSKEMTLSIKDFSAQIATPAMQAIAQSIDSDIIAVGVEKAGKTVSGTSAATNLADIASIGKALDLNKAPAMNRRLVLHPTHKYRYVTTDNLSKVAYAGDSVSLREAQLGRVYTMDTYMSQNAPDTLAGTAGTATAFKVAGTAGESKVALSAVSAATATVKNGDGFILDGYLYRFTADGTAVSSAIDEIAIDQPLHKTFTATSALLVNTTNSLGFHRNGLALVTRQLELPMGASQAAIAQANGIAVRVVFGYDMETKTDTVSFDTIYGIKELDTDLLVKLVG